MAESFKLCGRHCGPSCDSHNIFDWPSRAHHQNFVNQVLVVGVWNGCLISDKSVLHMTLYELRVLQM